MAQVRMIPEDEATGVVKDIYEDIRRTLNIEFVPNLYRVMAANPPYLEASWRKVKAVMVEPGQLDRLTKDHRGRSLCCERMRVLTAGSCFRGAEAWA